jgi:hypothetical protein
MQQKTTQKAYCWLIFLRLCISDEIKNNNNNFKGLTSFTLLLNILHESLVLVKACRSPSKPLIVTPA